MLIAGPTASGKSRLALDLAQAGGGIVVNADSMQVYDGLRILTARPSDDDLRAAPHRLYGHVSPTADAYSVGEWVRDAASVLADILAQGRLPIVCGGTGLYFRALLGGLDDMPSADPAVRAYWRERAAADGAQSLHSILASRDPDAASRIKPGDGQRIVRALEMIETTGRSLTALRKPKVRPLIDPSTALKLVLTPPRALLRERIGLRFDHMIESGALEETRRFSTLPGALAGPAGKAIGVAELHRHLRGEIDLPEAVRLSVTRSRQYAKRQDTWFRHQMDGTWRRIEVLVREDRNVLIDLVKSR